MNTRRTLVKPESLHAFCNCARTHQHDLFAHLPQLRNLISPFCNRGVIQSFALIRHERGTYFDNDALCRLNDGRHEEAYRGNWKNSGVYFEARVIGINTVDAKCFFGDTGLRALHLLALGRKIVVDLRHQRIAALTC